MKTNLHLPKNSPTGQTAKFSFPFTLYNPVNQRENLALDQESLRALFPTPLQLCINFSRTFSLSVCKLLLINTVNYCEMMCGFRKMSETPHGLSLF